MSDAKGSSSNQAPNSFPAQSTPPWVPIIRYSVLAKILLLYAVCFLVRNSSWPANTGCFQLPSYSSRAQALAVFWDYTLSCVTSILSLFFRGDFSFTECHPVSRSSYSLWRIGVLIRIRLRSQAAGGEPVTWLYFFPLLAAVSPAASQSGSGLLQTKRRDVKHTTSPPLY